MSFASTEQNRHSAIQQRTDERSVFHSRTMSISYGKKVGITLLFILPANQRGFVIMLSLSLDEGNTPLLNSLGDLRQQSRSWTYARIVGERKESEQAHGGGYGRTGGPEGIARGRARGLSLPRENTRRRRSEVASSAFAGREDEGGRGRPEGAVWLS